MDNAEKFVHPTKFTGEYPYQWNGYSWLDWVASANSYHPGIDYNLGYGDDDCGQNVVSCANGKVWHTSEKNTGYGKMVIVKHTLGYNLKRFIKETYGIETDELYSLYAHLKEIIVAVGNEIDCGAKIAEVGKTGTKWCHLHFEIYSLWKALKHTSYRFYPVNWAKEKVEENWLPAYRFIEATKQVGSFEEFLGKPKEYWEQLEKDRESLMKQLQQKDDEFLKKKKVWMKRLEDCEKSNEQSEDRIDSLVRDLKTAESSCKKKVEEIKEDLSKKEEKIVELKNRITEILAEQSEKYKIGEAVILLIETIKKYLKGGLAKK